MQTPSGNNIVLHFQEGDPVSLPISSNLLTPEDLSRCPNYQEASSIEVPESIILIEHYTFRNCTSLTTLSLPDRITRIGDSAFLNCTSLATLSLPDRITSIGKGAFWDCTSLTTLHLPDSITHIGEGAFKECRSLTTLSLPDRITSIGNDALKNCNKLSTIITTRSTLEAARNATKNFPGIQIFAIEDLYPSLKNSTSKSKNAALSLLDLTTFDPTFDPALTPLPLLKIPQSFLSKENEQGCEDAHTKYCHTNLFSKFSHLSLAELETLFETNSFKVLEAYWRTLFKNIHNDDIQMHIARHLPLKDCQNLPCVSTTGLSLFSSSEPRNENKRAKR